MTIQHHPGDELLLALAAGRLAGGEALLVSVHLEGCAECRIRFHGLQTVGGELLEAVDPEPLGATALAITLERLDHSVEPVIGRVAPRRSPPPAMPPGAAWPASLRGCAVSGWHWMGPGMRWSRVKLPFESAGSLFLLRIGPGRSLPRHTHRDIELTQVLCGSFDDGRALFGPGDFDAADEAIHHQPVVQTGGECVCLAYVGGRLRFDGRIASMIGGLIGM